MINNLLNYQFLDKFCLLANFRYNQHLTYNLSHGRNSRSHGLNEKYNQPLN
jgi:hypothetical protein